MQKCLIISISINMYFGTKNSIELVKKERERKKRKREADRQNVCNKNGKDKSFRLIFIGNSDDKRAKERIFAVTCMVGGYYTDVLACTYIRARKKMKNI